MDDFSDRTIKPSRTFPPSMDSESKKQLPRIQISTYVLSQLISLVPMGRTEQSPLPDNIRAIPPGQKFKEFLVKYGWGQFGQDNRVILLPEAKQAVQALLAPRTSVQLVLGSPREMAITQLFSAGQYAENTLVIYKHQIKEDLHTIRPGQSPEDISDALLGQLLNGPHLEGLQFELNLGDQRLLTYLTILDLIYSRQLRARLEGESFAVLNFTSEDLWNRFSEIRLGEDLMWLSALVPYLFPYFPGSLDEKAIAEELAALGEAGLITVIGGDHYQPNDFTQALAKGLLPMISFGSCAIGTGKGIGMHLGFIIGLNTNMVIKAEPMVEGNRVTLVGEDGVQLSRLLFELGLPLEKE